MDRGAWRATVHTVAESQTRLEWLGMHTLNLKGKKICSNTFHLLYTLLLHGSNPSVEGGTLLFHKEVDIKTWALTYGECLVPDTFCSKQKLSEVRRTVGRKEVSGNINSQDLCHQLLRCIIFLWVIYHSLEGNKMRVSKINDNVWIGGKPGVRCYVICSRNVHAHTHTCTHACTHTSLRKVRDQQWRWRYLSKRELSASEGGEQNRVTNTSSRRTWPGLTWVFHGAEGALHTPGLPVQTAALRIRRLLADKRPATHILVTQMFPAQILVDIGFFNLLWKGRHGSTTIALLFLFHRHCGRSQRLSKFPSRFLSVTSK